MADAARRPTPHAGNAPGALFVDTRCIDCDQCRQLAPEVFGAAAGHSVVRRQPDTPARRERAAVALVTCPTGSIHAPRAAGALDARAAASALPEPITGDGRVLFCGYAAEASYGASSYLVRRAAGNVLVDSPRFAAPLVRRLEALGGVALMVLTHRDDVADHRRFAAHFGCRRVLHRADVTAATRDVEITPAGHAPVALAEDLLFVPTPGHTRGHAVLLHAERHLFSGDHLAFDPDAGELVAWPEVCWYDWPTQVASLRRLLDLDFEWLLPGHGHRLHLPAGDMRSSLLRLVGRLERGPAER
jgi:glyoxylase-like metal-dependent hydrolase (beta-lactamase superfamily II)/ferredoxin